MYTKFKFHLLGPFFYLKIKNKKINAFFVVVAFSGNGGAAQNWQFVVR
jgi:hypothetical protein